MLTIEEIKEKVRPICERYKIDRMWVFSMYDLDTQTNDKSVFVGLCTDGGVYRGFEYGGVYGDLEEALNARISLTDRQNKWLNPFTKQAIAEDKVLVYEK